MSHDNPPGDARRRKIPAKSNLVLVHGLGVDHRMWNRLLPRLEESYHVFNRDLPGFGAEPPIPLTGTAIVEEYADWLADEVIRALDASVVLAGYSMGATIAVALAARHPELVERLVLAAGVTRWGGGVRSLAAAFPGLTARFLKARATGELKKLLCDGEERRLMYKMFSGADMTTMATLAAQLLSSDFGCLASAVRCPTLIVSGECDPLADPGRVSEMERAIPDATLIVIPGANHYFCVTHAEKLAGELISFGVGRKFDAA